MKRLLTQLNKSTNQKSPKLLSQWIKIVVIKLWGQVKFFQCWPSPDQPKQNVVMYMYREGGRGQWAVYYTGPHSFHNKVFLIIWLSSFVDFINFLCLMHYVKCSYVSTTNFIYIIGNFLYHLRGCTLYINLSVIAIFQRRFSI